MHDRARFAFGRNWARYLATLTAERMALAADSLRERLGDLSNQRFLDIGSGSGLFSLAAVRLGATVHSFDHDPECVACTEYLRRTYAPHAEWVIGRGSALDAAYLRGL